jgi:HK97 family phage major capsid protein
MASITELRTKREKLLLDARALLTSDNVTTEQRVNAEKMIADAEATKRDIDNLTAIESATCTEPGSARSKRGAGLDFDNRTPAERRAATNHALRTFLTRGADHSQIESRDLTIAADGSATIPTGIAQPRVALKSSGAIYDLVRKFPTQNGEPMTIPLWNDVTNSWVLNSAPVTVTDPSVTGGSLSVDLIRRNPVLVDNSYILDVSFDVVTMVEEGFDMTYRLTVANWITNGNGSNVKSIITTNTNSYETLAAGVLAYKDLTKAISQVDPSYLLGAAWSMSQTTLAESVMDIEDSNGRPIFLNFLDGGTSGFVGTLLGYPVKQNPFMPAVATGNVAVQFGNFDQGYTLREVAPGIRIENSSIPFMTTDKTAIVAFARVSGQLTDAGTHPLVNIEIQ